MISFGDSRMKLKNFMLKLYKDRLKEGFSTAYNSKSRMKHHIIPLRYNLNDLSIGSILAVF